MGKQAMEMNPEIAQYESLEETCLMVKTLQTLCALSLTSAILVFAFCSIQWIRNRPDSTFDMGPSVVEKFKQLSSEDKKGFKQTESPLVVQAKAFASYLNPPPSTKPMQTQSIKPSSKGHITKTKKPKISPKFTLLATSYYRATPEESLALISEPGKEARWMKQGESLGHFILSKIEKGKIVYRDGKRLEVMAINTKVPIHTNHIQKTTLASHKTRTPRPKSSRPDKPQKAGPRRSIRRLGPHAKLSM